MRRQQQVGLAAAGIALRLSLAAAVVVAPREAAAQEPRSSEQTKTAPGARTAPGEPEFKPGIPGLKMADVRDHKHLWREIEELQGWERTERVSIAEYRSKVIEKTAQFLELDRAVAPEFTAVASGAVTSIRESFLQKRRASGGMVPGAPSAAWSTDGAYFSDGSSTPASSAGDAQFQADLDGAVTRVKSFLKDTPRHQLFAPDCEKWLLKLAFGPEEKKEAKQAKPAQADKAGEPR